MTDRSKRVLWLLQHKTLMQAEVPILRRLGYEVFVPKILPKGVRSAATTFEHDESLTIPAAVIESLNRVDFYRGEISDEIAAQLNEHFGIAFTIALQGLHRNVLRRFGGAIVFRAFGTPVPDNYYRQLLAWDPDSIPLVNEVRERFWFGAGYPQLSVAEPPLLAERDVYLPIALPDSFVRPNAATWRGDQRQILFFCADILSHPANGAHYRAFKDAYGDLPHVIVGGQTTPIDDPHVIGFVSDDELIELMRASSAMVYPSREPRHVQYHPIEASVIGLPVVFYRDSLLGTLLETTPFGAVRDDAEGRALVERLLDGDSEAVQAVRSGEHLIAERFSEAWCEPVWAANLAASGIRSAIGAPPAPDLRDFDTAAADHLIPRERLIVPGEPVDPAPIRTGIDFHWTNLSASLAATYGFAFPEAWGRWVLNRTLKLRLAEAVSGAIEVEITGGSHHVNHGRPIGVRLGDATAEIRLDTWIESPGRSRVTFSLTEPTDLLTVTAPEVLIDGSGRPLSIGISRLRIRRRPSWPVRVARRGVGATLRALRRVRNALRRA